MLASVVINQYSLADTNRLADAIEELCSPNDTYGWSSSGIYCFWDVESKEVLYVGLAIDLPLRFRQHNDLSPCQEDCCKRARILAHFQSHAHLGYSAFVQSSMTQAITHRWEATRPGELEWIAENFGYFDATDVKEDLNREMVNALRVTEGTMLAAHKKDHGHFPAWNEIGGLKLKYSKSELDTGRYFLQSLTHAHPRGDPFTVRCTFRELAANSILERFEMFLHGVRIHMRVFGVSLNEACDKTQDGFGDLPRIRADGYLAKQPLLIE